MSTQAQDILSSFDQLPASIKGQVFIELFHRFVSGLTTDTAAFVLQQAPPVQPTYPLRGEPVKIEDPFAPAVPPEDWSAVS